MSVWVTIPSARPVDQVEAWAKAWKERGYKIALWRESMEFPFGVVDYFRADTQYPGYAVAVNSLIADVMESDDACDFAVIGGDDVQPDLNHSAEEIARECKQHFFEVGLLDGGWKDAPSPTEWSRGRQTFGVMQATGDRWGENPNHARPDMRGAYIDRVCGSAWIGREFAKRAYGGKGPLWHEYRHMFVDEELQHVATRLGVLWQRRDLTQLHMHAGRVKNYTTDMIPPHLRKWTIGEEGRAHWKESERLFFSRRDAGFPGHEPI